MKNVLIILIISLFGQFSLGQNTPITFVNYPKDDNVLGQLEEPKINEITLKNNNQFEFWSRPLRGSCYSWRSYNGKWTRKSDTIIFSDKYEVLEIDAKFNFSQKSIPYYSLHFITDNNSNFKNKNIEIKLVYDFEARLDDIEQKMNLQSDNSLQINFKDIPNHDKLASIRYEYIMGNGQKRYGYITETGTVNSREKELPNVIKVTLIEQPKKEVIFRTTKAILLKNELRIISAEKTESVIKDYHSQLVFEEKYKIQSAK